MHGEFYSTFIQILAASLSSLTISLSIQFFKSLTLRLSGLFQWLSMVLVHSWYPLLLQLFKCQFQTGSASLGFKSTLVSLPVRLKVPHSHLRQWIGVSSTFRESQYIILGYSETGCHNTNCHNARSHDKGTICNIRAYYDWQKNHNGKSHDGKFHFNWDYNISNHDKRHHNFGNHIRSRDIRNFIRKSDWIDNRKWRLSKVFQLTVRTKHKRERKRQYCGHCSASRYFRCSRTWFGNFLGS